MDSSPGLRARIEDTLTRLDNALSHGKRWPLVILVVAFVLKLVFVLQTRDALYIKVPIMDARDYDQMAQQIAAGNLMRHQAFFMGPLYPYFLGLIYSLFGRDFTLVRIIQAAGGATTVMLTFLIGRRVFRPSAALAGVILLVLCGSVTFFETELLMEWLGSLLNCFALWLLITAKDDSRWTRYALAGAALGLSALARASILIFAIFALVWVWRNAGVRRRSLSLAYAGALVLMLLPAMIHNAVVSHVFLPVTSNAGVNFYIGNSRTATGRFEPIAEVDIYDDFTTQRYLERKTGRELSPAEVSQYWVKRTLEDMRAQPARAAGLLAKKYALFFNGYEVPQIESFYIIEREFSFLRALFVRMWPVVTLAILGLILSWRAGRNRGLLAGYVLVYGASIALFFVTGRYRAQAVPILCLFAGHALVTIPGRVHSLRSGAAAAAAVLALLVATSPALFADDPKLIEFGDRIHRARRLSELRSFPPALREADAAIALYPNVAEGYLQRAIVYKESSNQLKALEDYQHALKIDDKQPGAHYNLAQCMRRLSLREQAVKEYRRSVELDPWMVEAYNNLGITLRELGHGDEAIVEFKKAIAQEPTYRRAYNNLGASYAEAGRMDEAINVFKETTQRFPDYAQGYKNLAMAYASLRQPAPALEAMRRYAELAPDDPQAAEAVRKLEIATRSQSAAPPDTTSH
ncbi:MAG TPA: tetratricopeptide repeat protein [Candidatus Krumholzibacteria bacterium]|nr:tetratricopeptide repeat protein [Candidatus Krumholzibacteria bacterium]